MASAERPAPALLLMGLPSAGKTTLGGDVREALEASGARAEVLDGDVLRRELPPGLGFSPEDRHAQGVRAAYIGRLLARHGVVPILCLVAPLEATREAIRESLGTRLVTVELAAPRDVRVARDTSGVYARCLAEGDPEFHRVEDVWESPAETDLRLDTSRLDRAACRERIVAALGLHTPLARRTVV
jgi:adenylylsulfate kinase